MKKLVAVILAALVVAVTPVYASEVDLSGMSLEELMELRDQVGAAIAAELGTNGTFKSVPSGAYEVGVDIPAGKYSVLAPSSNKTTLFFTYESKEEYDADNPDEMYDAEYDSTILVELKEGEVMKTSYELLFAKATPITFD